MSNWMWSKWIFNSKCTLASRSSVLILLFCHSHRLSIFFLMCIDMLYVNKTSRIRIATWRKKLVDIGYFVTNVCISYAFTLPTFHCWLHHSKWFVCSFFNVLLLYAHSGENKKKTDIPTKTHISVSFDIRYELYTKCEYMKWSKCFWHCILSHE